MLKPMWPYYGSKWRAARLYGPPRFDEVVEPFAGSACYALYHEPKRVRLFDVDPRIFGIWDYLIHVPAAEVRALPLLKVGDNVETDYGHLPQEARWLLRWWINRGTASPAQTVTKWSTRTAAGQLIWGEKVKNRIATQVERIRHWKIFEMPYWCSEPNGPATWFVDPPYNNQAGRRYKYTLTDYSTLSQWCQQLPGEVIVCENAGATWLPFKPLASLRSTRGHSEEVFWRNDLEAA